MLGRRPDVDDRVVEHAGRDLGLAGVARRDDDGDTMLAGVADRVAHVGRARDGVRPSAQQVEELDREVDDLGAVIDGVADAGGDRPGASLAQRVEDAHGHDVGAVGDPDHAEVVVGRRRDGAGDERPVTAAIVGVRVVGDEVVAGAHALGGQVGRALERRPVGVGHAGVDHRDLDALAAPRPEGRGRGPRARGVDAERPDQVPLDGLPATGGAGGAGPRRCRRSRRRGRRSAAGPRRRRRRRRRAGSARRAAAASA